MIVARDTIIDGRYRALKRLAQHRGLVLRTGVIRRLHHGRAVVGQLDLEPADAISESDLHGRENIPLDSPVGGDLTMSV